MARRVHHRRGSQRVQACTLLHLPGKGCRARAAAASAAQDDTLHGQPVAPAMRQPPTCMPAYSMACHVRRGVHELPSAWQQAAELNGPPVAPPMRLPARTSPLYSCSPSVQPGVAASTAVPLLHVASWQHCKAGKPRTNTAQPCEQAGHIHAYGDNCDTLSPASIKRQQSMID